MHVKLLNESNLKVKHVSFLHVLVIVAAVVVVVVVVVVVNFLVVTVSEIIERILRDH